MNNHLRLITFQTLQVQCVQNPETNVPEWSMDEKGTKLPKCIVGCRNDFDCGPEFGINWEKKICEKGVCVAPRCQKQLPPDYNAVSYDTKLIKLYKKSEMKT